MSNFWQKTSMAHQNPDSHMSRCAAPGRTEQPVVLKAKGSSGQQRRNKYGAEKTEVDGRVFASKREAERYQELKILEQAGEIKDLICQWRYRLEVNGTLICHYIADFVYVDLRTKKSICEDVKGVKTPLYKLKKKLMFAVYGISIKET